MERALANPLSKPRSAMFAKLLDLLLAPELPGQILAVSGSIATLIVVTGIGIWGIIGAYKVFIYLVGGDSP